MQAAGEKKPPAVWRFFRDLVLCSARVQTAYRHEGLASKSR